VELFGRVDAGSVKIMVATIAFGMGTPPTIDFFPHNIILPF
jgi:superfamily II DNA helicase RecQ